MADKYEAMREAAEAAVRPEPMDEIRIRCRYRNEVDPTAILALLAERATLAAQVEALKDSSKTEAGFAEAWRILGYPEDREAVWGTLLHSMHLMKEDADRYRWLRGPDHESTRYSRWRIEYWGGPKGWQPAQRESMDAAIDAARKEQQP